MPTRVVSLTTTSQEVESASVRRKHFSVQNRGNQNIYVHFGVGPATVDDIEILPGGYFETVGVPTSRVHMVSLGTVNAVVTEE